MRSFFCLVLSVWLSFTLNGYSQEEVKPSITEVEVQEVIKLGNTFAFDLLKSLNKPSDNFVFSPYNISDTFALLYPALGKKDHSMLRSVFKFPYSPYRLYLVYQKIKESLLTRQNKSTEIAIATSIWYDESISIKTQYRKMISDQQREDIFKAVSFQKTSSVIKEINQWATKQTYNQINSLVDEQDISNSTKLVLAGTLYFKGSWKNPFSINVTKKMPFYVDMDQTCKVLTMLQEGLYQYMDNEQFQLVKIPYDKEPFYFFILLPKQVDGLSNVHLTQEHWEAALEGMELEDVFISLPKFNYDYDLDLKKLIKTMGGGSLFSSRVDFSPLTDKRNLVLSKVFHKSKVQIHEKGSEAVATSGAIINLTSALPKKKSAKIMKVDHPFLFFITFNQQILFIGQCINPEK